MGLAYKETITVKEMNQLRKSVGFRQLNEEQLKCSLEGSAMIVSAYDDRAVGMARLIWDTGSTGMITDLLVHKDYRNNGIEERLLSMILDFLREQLEPGYGIQIDIKGWDGQLEALRTIGFIESSIEKRGQSMHFCLTKEIELTDKKFKQCEYD
jgi:GNAT superfamily N-acetyltransferase